MRSSYCAPCEKMLLESSGKTTQSSGKTTQSSGKTTQSSEKTTQHLLTLEDVEWSGVSFNIEEMVRKVNGENVRSKHKTPNLVDEEMYTYVEGIKNAYLEMQRVEGYETLSSAEREEIRNSVNGSHTTVSKWDTDRCKSILFRRVDAFISEKLGMPTYYILKLICRIYFYTLPMQLFEILLNNLLLIIFLHNYYSAEKRKRRTRQ